MQIVCAVAGAFLLWYLYFGLEYYLNGGTLGRDPLLMPFQCFWEEVRESIPGGIKLKEQRIREAVRDVRVQGSFLGRTGFWHYDDIRGQHLYRACARDVFRPPLEFWATVACVTAVGALIGSGAYWAYRGIVGFLGLA
ncbi:MAG: hypothetical protein IT406_01195 [Candidatus Yanofskybacteria bacterium]|nr:hypothetical protein [Candidatus Yanofskybacteria bacterium]